MFLNNNQFFHNSLKEITVALREALPSDVFVGTQIPTKRKPRMVILIDAGGGLIGPITRTQRINLMVWGGDTWEATGDFAFDVDFIMRGLGGIQGSQIISVEPSFFPVPSGDGESTSTPVYSSGYDLVVASQNRPIQTIKGK